MNILNRRYDRLPPSRDAKKIFIFCEGIKREKQYFEFFRGLDSRINLIVHEVFANQNNSPTGLFDLAWNRFYKNEGQRNLDEDYEETQDEVWFVIDTDTWGEKILELKESCFRQKNWSIAQSNPCFEVWLLYHCFSEKPVFEGMEISANWKAFVNDRITGGFDCRKHSHFIGRAINNAKNNFQLTDNLPALGCTEVYHLAEKIYPLVKHKIENG